MVPLYQTGRAYVMKPNVKGIVKHNISQSIALSGLCNGRQIIKGAC